MASLPVPGLWAEYRNPEGRIYWYNNQTKASSWEKPEELKTPFEKAMAKTPWKEHTSQGRKYWYHSQTKESKWEMPPELAELMDKVNKEHPMPVGLPPRPGAPNFVPGPIAHGDGLPAVPGLPINPTLALVGPGGMRPGPGLMPQQGFMPNNPAGAGSPLPTRPNMPDDPIIPPGGFATHDEAEKAFAHLLKKAGVDATWTWDRTMRAVITDPLYKALGSLAEKKAAWQKYVEAIEAKEKEERDSRIAKARSGIRTLLTNSRDIHYYTTFPTAEKLFAKVSAWNAAKIEEERRIIFDEFIEELKNAETIKQRELKTKNIARIVSLFKELDVDVLTKWRTAQQRVLECDEWKESEELRNLGPLDMLLAFEDYSRAQERVYQEETQKKTMEKARKDRKAREAFRELLDELVKAGRIRAKTKWKTVYPTFSEDERYINLLGTPGSNPIELFWDVVDQFDQALEEKVARVNRAMDSRGLKFSTSMTEDTLRDGIRGSREIEGLQDKDISEVFETFKEELNHKAAEELRKAERRKRHQIEDLRSALKKMDPPIGLDLPYEQAVPLMQDLKEYKVIEDDETRAAAFAKYVRKQKEKLKELSEDGGSTTSRKRKEPSHASYDRDRDRDRERDRDRKHHRDHDDYERDRDRDRDRHRDYRDRDYRDRDRDRDRDYRDHRDRDYRSSRYEREDRDRGHRSDRHRRDTMDVDRHELDYAEERARKKTRMEVDGREDSPEEGEI
ncbi:Pre-mRNA-processing protein PRP40 [Rhizoctonia solani AG-3 Rhs1AP]|uniref:Pre-mRNA-processing protein PRP40 n=1 Tax=Rhizoctonia solani AG-3 Rhs1AP TaxID=1086054 RepID=X8J102_9AGAM|nr:Pre-mRNA-processing protein PRP40 [Rhizoctonia solani AG-3 Rhs1AP]